MRSLLQDIAFFSRTLARSPGFFAVAVLTLAIGIGANTAIFSVINAVLLRPLPFRDADRLVRLYETEAAPGNYPFAGPDYLDWHAQNRTLEAMSLFDYYRDVNISGGGQPESAVAIAAEANFFAVLGVEALAGRTFGREESTAGGGAQVAVVSYGFWQRHFGGDAAIIGKSIEVDSMRHTVVGVMPAWFNYPKGTEVWTPLDMSPQNLGPRGSHSFLAVGRLKPGVTVSQALADLQGIARRLEQQYPDSNEQIGAAVVPLKEQLIRTSREPLLILLGAVALVLLVACANVANLLLIRAGGRRRELAIRSALGAGRWRVVRQLLTESVLLALAGATAGLVAAWWGVGMLRSVKTLPIPLANPIRIDLPVLAFTLTAAVLTGLLFGVLPALQASAAGLSDALKASSRTAGGTGGRTRRWRDAIAVAEIALSLALLVGAGLLLRSFERMRHAEIGADTRNVLTMRINLPPSTYATPVASRAFFDRLLARVRSTPGVRAASMSTRIPLEGGSNGYITVPGQDDSRLKNQLFEWNYVSADYFRAFGIPLQQGRAFAARDEDQAAEAALKVNEVFSSPDPQISSLKGLTWPAVISREMARLVWPGGQDPIGRSFVLGGVVNVQVIGVAGDAKARDIRSGNLPQAYFPFPGALAGPSPGPGNLTIRASGEPMALLRSIRADVAALDPTLAVVDPRTMDDVIADGMADTTLQTWLLMTFAAVAVVLAAVGLYSVMTFLVAERRHEMGLRIALGAGRRDLLRLVLGHAAKLIGIGLLAGVAAAWWLTRSIQGLLFGVTATDLPTFTAVSGLLVLVSLAACAVPAWRAMRADPIVALRYE
jgi:putative ABC transport system permease protein